MKVNIFDYGMNGEGVAKLDGKIILVPNALVGEEVEIEIEHDFKNYALAKLIKVISASPNRITSPCPYSECGGCSIMNMSYPEQLKFKQMLVRKTLKKILGKDFNVQPTVESPMQFNYRSKASFAFKNSAGFYKEHSNEIVEINSCILQDNIINEIYKLFNKFLDENLELKPQIKNLVVRVINGQILIGVVTKSKIDIKPFYNVVCQYYNANRNVKGIGLYLIINTRKDSVVLAGTVQHIAGIKEININNFNINYSIDLFAFHQNNIEIQNKIYKQVLSYIDKDSIVVNGFSGAGLLSAIVANKAKHVYGIEINKSAHNSAQKLKKLNKIANLTNILGDFGKNFSKIDADTLILDPSKKGCGKEVCQHISNVSNIIYISCCPTSLSKDLQYLLNNYIIEEIIPYDMFPNTNSVETLVKLKRIIK